jgi:SAM-dependent methyltransferase
MGALDRAPGPIRPRHENFDASYAGTPAWDIGRPQSAFLELAEGGVLRGRVLDIGCGTGEHALMAARLGYEATGIDTAQTAIAIAQGKARDRGLTARFLVGDALRLSDLDDSSTTCSTADSFMSLTTVTVSSMSTASGPFFRQAATFTCCASVTASPATGDPGGLPRTRSGPASAMGGGWTRSKPPRSPLTISRAAHSPGECPSAEADRHPRLATPTR